MEEEEVKSVISKKEGKKYLSLATDQTIKLVSGGLTFVAALAWNQAFTNFFNNNPIYKKKGGFWIYAVVVTIFAVIIIISLAIVNEKITNKIKK